VCACVCVCVCVRACVCVCVRACVCVCDEVSFVMLYSNKRRKNFCKSIHALLWVCCNPQLIYELFIPDVLFIYLYFVYVHVYLFDYLLFPPSCVVGDGDPGQTAAD